MDKAKLFETAKNILNGHNDHMGVWGKDLILKQLVDVGKADLGIKGTVYDPISTNEDEEISALIAVENDVMYLYNQDYGWTALEHFALIKKVLIK